MTATFEFYNFIFNIFTSVSLYQTLIERGVFVAGGSDSPIETCSPLVGMFDAIYRRSRSSALPPAADVDSISTAAGNSSHGKRESFCLDPLVFRAEECLSFSEALWLYTIGAAYAAGSEGFLGRLEVGYAADFVILDEAVEEDPTLLMTAAPVLVVVGGIVSYSRDESSISGIISSEIEGVSNSTFTMGGPYVPGKNGKLCLPVKSRKSAGPRIVHDESYPLTCACRLLGKYCVAVYK